MSNVGTRTVCKKDMCAGCMACVDSCRHGAIAIEDTIEAYNARIDPTRCVGCGLCEKTCPQMVSPSSLRPLEWLQGWAKDTSLRMSSSSGGLATAISEAFVASNGLVCSCAQEGGEFRFHLTSDADYLRRAQGSKYVKSNPLGAYREVREALQGGQRVLFIGLPCQVAAMRNFVGSRLADSLYTIDLICHGSPSPKVLSRFLEETGNNLSNELKLWVGRVSAIATRSLSSRVYRIRKAATPAATPRVIVSPILRLAIHGVASFLMRSRTGYPSHLCRQTRVENC